MLSVQKLKNKSPSEATWAQWAELITISLALSQTPADSARPHTWG